MPVSCSTAADACSEADVQTLESRTTSGARFVARIQVLNRIGQRRAMDTQGPEPPPLC